MRRLTHSLAPRGIGAASTFGILDLPVPVRANLANLEFGLQAAVLPAGGGLYFTNALRVRAGGGL